VPIALEGPREHRQNVRIVIDDENSHPPHLARREAGRNALRLVALPPLSC
jgi:hypothetical protein